MAQPIFLEAMAANCIPVIIADSLVMPFNSVLDWHRAAIFIKEENLSELMEVLKGISDEHVVEMQEQVQWLYNKYFSSMEKITLTTLDIIQDRVYPQWAKIYDNWNIPSTQVRFGAILRRKNNFNSLFYRNQVKIHCFFRLRLRDLKVSPLSS